MRIVGTGVVSIHSAHGGASGWILAVWVAEDAANAMRVLSSDTAGREEPVGRGSIQANWDGESNGTVDLGHA